MSDDRVDLAALPVKVWKAKLANARSHYRTDADPQVRLYLAALSFHRLRTLAAREEAAGHLGPGVVEILDKYSRFYEPEKTSGSAVPEAHRGPDSRGGGGTVSGSSTAAPSVPAEAVPS